MKIILAQCRSRTPRILQCKLCVGVTDSAFAQLLIGLVNVAAIALLMVRITRGRALRRCVTGAAFWRLSLTGHFLWIHVLPVRETLYAELTHLGGKTYSRALRIHRRFVTNNAHLTRRIRKIFSVALDTSRMTGKHGSHIVVRPLMAEAAVFRLCLVLGASMIEWRRALDYS
ncbi:MAG TPA: hypothetical protein VKN18_19755 [Blastocatellia bacterium]|nr:hypothetical protein [Blastocatellia bacterium]